MSLRTYSVKHMAAVSAAVCGLGLTAANSQEPIGWLCVEEKATGFVYKRGQWRSTVFDTEDAKFLFTIKDVDWADKPRMYVVQRLGEDTPIAFCDQVEPSQSGIISCSGVTKYILNVETNRFKTFYMPGYTDGRDKGENTPSVSIGTCSKL